MKPSYIKNAFRKTINSMTEDLSRFVKRPGIDFSRNRKCQYKNVGKVENNYVGLSAYSSAELSEPYEEARSVMNQQQTRAVAGRNRLYRA